MTQEPISMLTSDLQRHLREEEPGGWRFTCPAAHLRRRRKEEEEEEEEDGGGGGVKEVSAADTDPSTD
ncbi:hypothetical protein F7725_008804, partial [Dissostichus mawsoni]